MMAWLLVLHFIADGLLQSREMARKKSVEFVWLFKHLLVQFWVFFVCLALFPQYHGHSFNVFCFALANALIHGVIDWNIWRFYKYSVLFRLGIDHMNQNHPDVAGLKNSWQYWEDDFFYKTIMLDQLLHGLTLVYLAGVFL